MNSKAESERLIERELDLLARYPQVACYLDSNVIMFSSKKAQIKEYRPLRTVDEVVNEVQKRPREQSGFLEDLNELLFPIFPDSNDGTEYAQTPLFIFWLAAQYSPITRQASFNNMPSGQNYASPSTGNVLRDATNVAAFLDGAREITNFISNVLGQRDYNGYNKLRMAWFRYHNKREKGIRQGTYSWTDEALVTAAITEAFVNRCVSIILTTDWDSFVIMKQFIDNAIICAVDDEMKKQQLDISDTNALFDSRCREFDQRLDSYRAKQEFAILDGNMFASCEPGDVIIWLYSTSSHLSFNFCPRTCWRKRGRGHHWKGLRQFKNGKMNRRDILRGAPQLRKTTGQPTHLASSIGCGLFLDWYLPIFTFTHIKR